MSLKWSSLKFIDKVIFGKLEKSQNLPQNFGPKFLFCDFCLNMATQVEKSIISQNSAMSHKLYMNHYYVCSLNIDLILPWLTACAKVNRGKIHPVNELTRVTGVWTAGFFCIAVKCRLFVAINMFTNRIRG